MRTKPWSLIILALIHFIAPIGSLYLNGINMNRSFSAEWRFWFNELPKTLLFLYFYVPMILGSLIYVCRKWSYWFYVAGMIFLLGYNCYSLSTHFNISSLILFLAFFIGDVVLVAYFVVPAVQNVYLDPNVRWWEAANRYHFDVATLLNKLNGQIKSISRNGLYFETDHTFKMGDVVLLEWSFEGRSYSLKANITFLRQLDGKIGYGARFIHDRETEKIISNLMRTLHVEGKIVFERLPGPEDSFWSWFKKLVTTGQGLFPKTP